MSYLIEPFGINFTIIYTNGIYAFKVYMKPEERFYYYKDMYNVYWVEVYGVHFTLILSNELLRSKDEKCT